MKPSWKHADYDRCSHPSCDKHVNNKQMKCAEHRIKTCRRSGCKVKLFNGLYCNTHQPCNAKDGSKEYMIEI